jgi:hypothetical protein
MMGKRHFGTSGRRGRIRVGSYRVWVLWRVCVAYTLWALALAGGGGCVAATAGPALSSVTAPRRTEPTRLAFDDVLRELSLAAGVSPVARGARRALLRSRPSRYPEDRYTISVAEEGERLRIHLVAGGGHGFTVLREFFECPLFTRAESEALHGLLSTVRYGPVRRVGRFRASVRWGNTEDALWLTFWLEPVPPPHRPSSCRGQAGNHGLCVVGQTGGRNSGGFAQLGFVGVAFAVKQSA